MNKSFWYLIIAVGLVGLWSGCETANLLPPPVVLLTGAVAQDTTTGIMRNLDSKLTEFVIDTSEVLTLGWQMKAEDNLTQIDCSYNGDPATIQLDSTYKKPNKSIPILRKRDRFSNPKQDVCDVKVKKLQGRLAITLQATDRQNRKTALTKQVVVRGR